MRMDSNVVLSLEGLETKVLFLKLVSKVEQRKVLIPTTLRLASNSSFNSMCCIVYFLHKIG